MKIIPNIDKTIEEDVVFLWKEKWNHWEIKHVGFSTDLIIGVIFVHIDEEEEHRLLFIADEDNEGIKVEYLEKIIRGMKQLSVSIQKDDK